MPALWSLILSSSVNYRKFGRGEWVILFMLRLDWSPYRDFYSLLLMKIGLGWESWMVGVVHWAYWLDRKRIFYFDGEKVVNLLDFWDCVKHWGWIKTIFNFYEYYCSLKSIIILKIIMVDLQSLYTRVLFCYFWERFNNVLFFFWFYKYWL